MSGSPPPRSLRKPGGRDHSDSEGGDKIQGIPKRRQVICSSTAKPLPSLRWYGEAVRKRAAEGNSYHVVFRCGDRKEPVAGFAKNSGALITPN
ncbi:hypothetical protein AU255_10180 [Methyloprofundus sedimenti]|uniref:Uncharacterized protein n=1 Tax=Methyloprofundus sedimenti TaxID=1420851 RepID=A0A1V8M9E9_9GAMM|nr:hypothetical protein AU255_10180 [Methyloprofundus sedimenti]